MKIVLPGLLAVLSGLCLALAMPGAGLAVLAFAAVPLLLEALHRGEGRWRPWLLGWLAGATFWIVATNWVLPVMHHYGGLPWPEAFLCLLGMGLILGIFWALAAGLASLVPPAWRVWLLPAAWTAAPLLQQWPPFQFIWTGPAAAFVDWPWLMSTLPVWGATGLGWWVAALSAGAWGLCRRDTRLGAVAEVAVAMCLVLAFSLAAPAARPAGQPLRVAVLQPGTSLEDKWDPSQAGEIANRVWALTGAVAVRGADLVAWPESAVPFRLDADASYREAVTRMARELGTEIILNSVASTGDGGYTNSAFLVTSEGVHPRRYDKVHLVPFGEFVPSWASFAFTESLVREVGRFTPGDRPVVLPAQVPVGVTICFEVVFPGLPAAQVRDGAELLLTLTNDGWYGFSWAPHQHFAQVRLRAAENRRWFVRAALTGISGFVNPTGSVVSSLGVGEDGFLIEELQPMTGVTPRARWGDWWGWLCVLATAVILVVARIFRPAEASEGEPR
ncbi:MAG: apolipoprotein N-acyltransferase [Holophagae bacterium]